MGDGDFQSMEIQLYKELSDTHAQIHKVNEKKKILENVITSSRDIFK